MQQMLRRSTLIPKWGERGGEAGCFSKQKEDGDISGNYGDWVVRSAELSLLAAIKAKV